MGEEKSFRAGGVELRVENRTFGEDGGPAVRVFADVNGRAVQVLRFDCFRKDPHYHYDPSGKDDQRALNKEEVPDPVAWTIECLGQDLTDMIRTAGYGGAAEKIDEKAVAVVLPEVEAIMRE